MAFDEVELDSAILFDGYSGGPSWQTIIVPYGNNFEQRNQWISEPFHRYKVAYTKDSTAGLIALVTFFNARRAKLRGFRVKDPIIYTGTDELLGAGDGTDATFQIRKAYTNAGQTVYYTIRKPESSGNTVKIGASLGAAISTTQGWSISTTTGILTFTPVTATISAITKANPGVITTSAPHGLTTGHSTHLSGIGGMTELNSTRVAATVINSTSFSIGVNTTSYTTYTTGGQAKTLPQTGENVYWSGEFRIPVRFDTDDCPVTALGNNVFQVAFALVEVKED